MLKTEHRESRITGSLYKSRFAILDFSLIGILAEIASVLADHAIPIYAVSTYNTDYIFIKKENYEKSLEILEVSGYHVTE